MLVANRASTEVIDVFIDLNKGTGSDMQHGFYTQKKQRKNKTKTRR
jgi:hypothetical protein